MAWSAAGPDAAGRGFSPAFQSSMDLASTLVSRRVRASKGEEMSNYRRKRGSIANWSLYRSGEILGVIRTDIDRHDAIKGTTEEMSSAAIAMAIRRRPPEAVALAIMAAHRRHNSSISRN